MANFDMRKIKQKYRTNEFEEIFNKHANPFSDAADPTDKEMLRQMKYEYKERQRQQEMERQRQMLRQQKVKRKQLEKQLRPQQQQLEWGRNGNSNMR